MSVLARRSLLVLALLFGLLFAIGTAVLWHYNVNVWYAIPFAVFMVALQYLIGPVIIQWIFKINWISPESVTPELAAFLTDACRRDKIPVPRFGVIEDGNPNAFTFGHHPGDARLVVTRGLVDMLNEEELEAVVGHELGHIKHWDFVVMTIASLVPLILYYVYIFTRYRGRDKNGAPVLAIAIASYIAYIVSQYIVLFLSRVREYYADYHSAKTTHNPNALASALVTIAYGLAKAAPPEPAETDKKKRKQPVFDRMGAISSLSFSSKTGASYFAMASADASGNFSPENMKLAMRWDLYNPWARLFELQSTHPLAARRIREVEKFGRFAQQTPAYEFASAPESYWPKFVADIAVAALPYIGVLTGAGLAFMYGRSDAVNFVKGGGYVIFFLGLGMLLRTLFSYRSGFQPRSIVSLVTETDVSHVRPIPATIKGKIIGRGVPGLFWSHDLVLQDENGFITLIYRQPLGFLETLFGMFKAGSFVGKEATVEGWYRRGPGPYFEMKSAIFEDGGTANCYYYQFTLTVSAIIAAVGLALMFVRMVSF